MIRNSRTYQFANILAYIAMIVTNYLSISLPLNGQTTQAVSALYPNVFVPAGIVFPIVWSTIYIWLGIWLIYSWRHQKSANQPNLGWLFVISALLNAVWLFAWHWLWVELATLIMAALLFVLIKINIEINRRELTPTQRLAIQAPFGIYQGWITVATIAMFTALLVSLGISNAMNESFWAISMAFVGALIAFWMMFDHQNVWHGVVVSFALFGIWLKQNGRVDSVAYTALALAIVLLFAAVWATYRIWKGEPEDDTPPVSVR
jgi:tryptophan-rich sensory protein